MKKTLTQQYEIIAVSPKYGNTTVSLTLSFDNENNTSTLTIGDGFVIGGQTSGYTSDGASLANSDKQDNKTIKLHSLKALTKLGTNHLYIFKEDEVERNKQTRFVCDLTLLSFSIKNDIYKWRKNLKNE